MVGIERKSKEALEVNDLPQLDCLGVGVGVGGQPREPHQKGNTGRIGLEAMRRIAETLVSERERNACATPWKPGRRAGSEGEGFAQSQCQCRGAPKVDRRVMEGVWVCEVLYEVDSLCTKFWPWKKGGGCLAQWRWARSTRLVVLSTLVLK